MRVLSTGRDIASFRPNSGAELLHSSVGGQDSVTICTRFNTYQFTLHNYGEGFMQYLLTRDSEPLFALAPMINEFPLAKQYLAEGWRNGYVMVMLGEMALKMEKLLKQNGTDFF